MNDSDIIGRLREAYDEFAAHALLPNIDEPTFIEHTRLFENDRSGTSGDWGFDSNEPHFAPEHRPRARFGRRSRPLVLVGGVVAGLATLVVAVLLIPTVAGQAPGAAATELRLIASKAEAQTQPQLESGQWLFTQERVSFTLQVTQVGTMPTPNAEAEVTSTIEEWSDNAGESCTSMSSSPAQFTSPTNEAAWEAAGFADRPNPHSLTNCTSLNGATDLNGLGAGSGTIDVSSLPTDPSVLADELTTGTTGIAGLDRIETGFHLDPAYTAFKRAVMLLVGPDSGSTPAFKAALFDAIAMLPGIKGIGQTTSHSGASGLGFQAPTGTDGSDTVPGGSLETLDSTIVVNPANGNLLEAQNLELPTSLGWLDNAYIPLDRAYIQPPSSTTPTAPDPAIEGFGFVSNIQWIDPVGVASVVSTVSLPANVQSGLNPKS